MQYSSTRRLGANFNFCGYDPRGEKAHIVAHIYGPTYCGPEYPAHCIPPRFCGKSQAPPRYGSPSLSQIPWLPAGFIPRVPPFYLGRPRGPYLPAPVHFDPDILGALVSRTQQRKVYDEGGVDQQEAQSATEVRDGGEC